MRLGAKKRIYFRTSRSGGRHVSRLLFALLLVSSIIYGAVYLLKVTRPVVEELACHQAVIRAEQSVHQAVNELLIENQYGEFIAVSRLADGSVSSLDANMTAVNQMKADAAIKIQEKLSTIEETEVKIPLGTLFGYDLLSKAGPYLSATLMVYGRVLVDLESEFTSVGVNQTRLTINLKATATVGAILPTGAVSRQVVTKLPVEQTVIVGAVPDNYVNIGELGEDYQSDLLDIIG